MVNRQQRKTIEKYSEELPLSGNLFQKNKRRISFFRLTKMLFIGTFSVLIVFAVLYGIVISNKTRAESITQDTVIKELSRQMVLPDEEILNIMRVQDAKNLIKQDSFYKNIENGDYIIIYPTVAIIYDFDSRLVKNFRTY